MFIDDEIKRRIAMSSSYLQKIIILRLYCDNHKDELGEIAWGYSSAILHGCPLNEIENLLTSAGVDEAEALKLMNDKLDLKLELFPKLIVGQ